MRNLKLLPLTLPLLMVSFLATSAESAPAKKTAALSVKLVSPSKQAVTPSIRVTGSVSALDVVTIPAQVSQVVSKVYAREGRLIKAGQTLALFDTTFLKLDIEVAKSAVEDANVSYLTILDKLTRNKQALAEGSVSSVEVSQLELQLQGALAKLNSAKSQLAIKNEQLARSVVSAPVAGTIVEKSVSEGDFTSVGQALFKLHANNNLEWRAQVPSTQSSRVSPGTKVSVTVNGKAILEKISRVSPTLEGSLATVAIVELPSSSGARIGQVLTGEVKLSAREATLIPVSAIVARDGNTYVAEVDLRNIVKFLKVEVGDVFGDNIELKSKLSSKIVKEGASFLNNGDFVKVTP